MDVRSDPVTQLGPLEEALAFQFLRTARLLRQDLSLTLLEVTDELTVEQFFLLYRLSRVQQAPQGALVDPDLGDKANITRQLVLLESRGLISRHGNSEDKRSLDVELLPAGHALMGKLVPRIVEGRDRLFGGLSPEEEAIVRKVLGRLRDQCRS